MADSDSESPFQSADEGEGEEKHVEGKDVEELQDDDTDKRGGDEQEVTSAAVKTNADVEGEVEVQQESSRTKDDGGDEPCDNNIKSATDPEDSKVMAERTESTGEEHETGKQGSESLEEKSACGDEASEVVEKQDEESSKEETEKEDGRSKDSPHSDAKAGGRPQQATASSGGWGWGGWGSSLLSSAAATVTAVSDNVGKGLTSVLENVESSLGVPKPEELTQKEKQELQEKAAEAARQSQLQEDSAETLSGGDEDGAKAESKEEEQSPSEPKSGNATSSGIGGFFSFGASAISNVMEKTVSGGLDALEALGRKTMDVLQEGDPRLEKKRALIRPGRDKVNLSEVLRQARDEAEAEAKRREEEEEHQKFNFGLLFDQYQGLAHLEALEMLSNQSETKVQATITRVSDDTLDELKTELMEVRDAFQLEEMEAVGEDTESDQDFVNVFTELLFSLSVAATPDKLQRVQKETKEWLSKHKTLVKEPAEGDEESKIEVKDVHAKAMQTLAELTARSIEQFHKVAELMLLNQDKGQAKSPVERATSLSKLTSILSAEVSSIATKFCELLSSMADQSSAESETVNPIITTIYLEASNSTSYIQDAFQLLLPILQAIAVDSKNEETSS